MFVCCECCVLSGRGLCDGSITRPGESYRLWRVVVCDQKNLENEEAKARYRAVKMQSQWVVTPGKQTNKHMKILKLFQNLLGSSFKRTWSQDNSRFSIKKKK